MKLPSAHRPFVKRVLVLLVIASAFAPLAAVSSVQEVTATIFGVDTLGNPSSTNAGTATGKLYKDDPTGILYEVVSGVVTNQFKKDKVRFYNLGVTINDPEADASFTATNDLEVVYRAKNNGAKALAGRIALWVPSETITFE